MNRREENKRLSIMDTSFHFKEGVIKFSKHETFEHFLSKCLYCYELKKNDMRYYTEAIFKNKKRADIYMPFFNEAHELIKSETKISIESKKQNYPCCVKFNKSEDIILQNGVIIMDKIQARIILSDMISGIAVYRNNNPKDKIGIMFRKDFINKLEKILGALN